jgi:hypothetical protein
VRVSQREPENSNEIIFISSLKTFPNRSHPCLKRHYHERYSINKAQSKAWDLKRGPKAAEAPKIWRSSKKT